jgi:hypothetical protein
MVLDAAYGDKDDKADDADVPLVAEEVVVAEAEVGADMIEDRRVLSEELAESLPRLLNKSAAIARCFHATVLGCFTAGRWTRGCPCCCHRRLQWTGVWNGRRPV